MSIIYVNPSQGNEPFICGTQLGVGVARWLKEVTGVQPQVVVPLLYGTRQRSIQQEIGVNDVVHCDERLGEISRPLFLDGSSFEQQLSCFLSQQERCQRELRSYIQQTYGDVTLEINIGAKMTSGQRAVYAFPCLQSELWRRTLEENRFSSFFSLLEPAVTKISEMENCCEVFYIPQYHTFSFDQDRRPHARENSVPPLKSPVSWQEKIPERSVYAMLSGTGAQVEEVINQSLMFQKDGRHIFVSPWAETSLFEKKHPDVIGSPSLDFVIGRAGGGTIWKCRVQEREFRHLPYSEGDDVEMFFTVRTLDEIPLVPVTQKIRNHFGTLDGIEYTTRQIINFLKIDLGL